MFPRIVIPLCLALSCLAQQPPPGKLKVNVLAGQGAVNNIVQGVAAQPAVEVLDESNAPVVGAEVTFEAPADGPGGTFFGTRTYTTRTDAKGRAQASGLAPNNQPGKFQIMARAKSEKGTGEAAIAQSNGGPGTPVSGTVQQNKKKFWIIAGIVAAAAAGGGVAASRNGGSGSSATEATKRPVTIGAGPITVGGPR